MEFPETRFLESATFQEFLEKPVFRPLTKDTEPSEGLDERTALISTVLHENGMIELTVKSGFAVQAEMNIPCLFGRRIF